jgi:hypothetical protein
MRRYRVGARGPSGTIARVNGFTLPGRGAAILGTAAAGLAAAILLASVAVDSASSAGLRSGRFAVPCKFSHRAGDDPIVSPGRTGASHLHDFFGNRTTRAGSTRETLLAGGTTCRRAEDTSGYWAPSLLVGGRIVNPQRAQIYYLTAGRESQTIRPFPAGLKMIAGNAAATGPQDPKKVSFGCAGDRPEVQTKPPLCVGRDLVLHVRFPDCWSGLATDSPDHASHMAYASHVRRQGMACPPSHPVPVPRIAFNVHYPTRGGPTTALSSGSWYTAHADFFEAWQPGALDDLVRRCLNAGVPCGAS